MCADIGAWSLLKLFVRNNNAAEASAAESAMKSTNFVSAGAFVNDGKPITGLCLKRRAVGYQGVSSRCEWASASRETYGSKIPTGRPRPRRGRRRWCSTEIHNSRRISGRAMDLMSLACHSERLTDSGVMCRGPAPHDARLTCRCGDLAALNLGVDADGSMLSDTACAVASREVDLQHGAGKTHHGDDAALSADRCQPVPIGGWLSDA